MYKGSEEYKGPEESLQYVLENLDPERIRLQRE